MRSLFATLLLLALLGPITPAAIAAPGAPKRILIIHSYPPAFEGGFAEQLRAELDRQMPGQLEAHESWMGSARLTSRGDDPALVNYLSELFVDRPVDLVIAIGSPAGKFLQKYHQELFPSTPELLTFLEQHMASGLKANQVALAYAPRDKSTIANILRILPDTKYLFVAMGHSPFERHSTEDIIAAAQAFQDRLTVVPLNAVHTFHQLLKRVSILPPHSAIYYELFFPDLDGTPVDADRAFAQVHAAAAAPIFSIMGEYYGKGIVGGPMIPYADYARQTASAARRILGGEPVSQIKLAPVHVGAPKYDARELERWGIKPRLLPPGSEIDYSKPSEWRQYRWQIVSAVSLILLQASLILGLMYEHRRRRTAEMEAHRHLMELARMNRRSAAGELSASIAHEINQPLAAIIANAEAAELTVPAAPTPQDLRELMKDIKYDAQRASEVIKRLRRMLADAPGEKKEVDLNEAIRETLEFLSNQVRSHHTTVITDLAPQAPRVTGDRIQLQQIILNLVMNALDAMASVRSQERRIVARTRELDAVWAEVSVADIGPGIPQDRLEQIFDPFFTTKEAGMGMGLSIVRTLVQSHGGRIWAENRSTGGAIFRFTLRLAKRASAAKPSARGAAVTSVIPFRARSGGDAVANR